MTPRRLQAILVVATVALGMHGVARADITSSRGDRSGEGSTPFTGLVQSPEATLFTGGLTVNVPIDLPSGRKAMTPQLALHYSNSGGPSPYGHGWDLPLGRIQRSTKWGVPTCSNHPTDFVLALPSGTVELVPDAPGSTTYRPTIEDGYVAAVLDVAGNRWTVHDRSGLAFTFGDATSARVSTDPGDEVVLGTESSAAPCPLTVAWALTHVEDPNGNSIDLTYTRLDNVLYPSRVSYGGNRTTGLAHFYHVDFTWQDRDGRDQPAMAMSGALATLRRRLQQIVITTTVPGSEPHVRTYTLAYDDTSPALRSLLHAVDVACGPGQPPAPCTPGQTFVYESAARGLAARAQPLPAPAARPQQRTFLRATDDDDQDGDVTHTIMDLTGDGFVDLLDVVNGSWTLYRGGVGGFPATGVAWSHPSIAQRIIDRQVTDPNQPHGWLHTRYDTVDLTGDGIPDWVNAQVVPWQVYPGFVTPGGGGFRDTPLQFPAPTTYLHSEEQDRNVGGGAWTWARHTLVDVTGDGRPDLVMAPAPGTPLLPDGRYAWRVYVNQGCAGTTCAGFAPAPLPYFPAPVEPVRVDVRNAANSGVAQQLVDFTGDGLADLLVADNAAPGCYPHPCVWPDFCDWSCVEVYANVGQGFAVEPTLIRLGGNDNGQMSLTEVEASSVGATWQDLVDVNGDGLPDWVTVCANQWYVQLNTGGQLEPFATRNVLWCPEGDTPWPGASGPIRQTKPTGRHDTTVDLIDVDGDGLLDHVRTGASGWTVQPNVAAVRPHTMIRQDDGLGGITLIDYLPSTSFDNTGGDGIVDLPFPVWLVSRIARGDGTCVPLTDCATGAQLVSTFAYADGRFEAVSREFRGFRTVHATDATGGIVASTFGQDEITKGRLLKRTSYAGRVDAARRVHAQSRAYTYRTIGTGRTQVWQQFESETRYDLGPAGADTITYVQDVDAYGNALATQRYSAAEPDLSIDTSITYATPANGGGHVYDKPAHTISYYTGPGGDAGEPFDEKWFFYDDRADNQVTRGNVTLVRSRLDPGGVDIDTRTTYDAYGNVTHVRDPLQATTRTVYDGVKLYPVQVFDPLDHVTGTVTDYRWGQPLRVTDSSGVPTDYRYDHAGRLAAVIRPGDSDATPTMRYTYAFGPAGWRRGARPIGSRAGRQRTRVRPPTRRHASTIGSTASPTRWTRSGGCPK